MYGGWTGLPSKNLTTKQNGNPDQFWPESEVHSDWSINKYERSSSVFEWQKIGIKFRK